MVDEDELANRGVGHSNRKHINREHLGSQSRWGSSQMERQGIGDLDCSKGNGIGRSDPEHTLVGARDTEEGRVSSGVEIMEQKILEPNTWPSPDSVPGLRGSRWCPVTKLGKPRRRGVVLLGGGYGCG